MKAKDWDFKWKGLGGGITIYPYQISLGISLRYWPCIHAPSIKIYFGPIKIWLYITLKRKE